MDVYRNLNKRDAVLYSLRECGRVIGHAPRVILAAARFKHATPAQLARVRTGPREVCQWVKGTRIDAAPDGVTWKRVSANPKTSAGFADAVTGQKIDAAAFVLLDSTGCYAGDLS